MPHALARLSGLAVAFTLIHPATAFLSAQTSTRTSTQTSSQTPTQAREASSAAAQRTLALRQGFYQLIHVETASAGQTTAKITSGSRIATELSLSLADAAPVSESVTRVTPAVVAIEAEVASLGLQNKPLLLSGQLSPETPAQQTRVRTLLLERDALVATEFTHLHAALDKDSAARVDAAILARFVPVSLQSSQVATPTMPDELGREVPATLAQMYRYAFHFQKSMEAHAAEREKDGESGTPFLDILRVRFGLSTSQFAHFRTASAEFNKQEDILRAQLRQEHKSVHPAATPALRAQSQAAFGASATRIRFLSEGIRASAASQLGTVHSSLGATTSAKLDTAIRAFYVEAQHATKGAPTHTGPGARASSAAAQSTSALASPVPNDDFPGEGGYCDDPYAYASFAFTTDGIYAVGYSEADIDEYDYEDGCYAEVEGELSQDGNIVADDFENYYDVEADTTLYAYVNVGSGYSEITSAISCDDYDDCSDVVYYGAGGQSGAPSIASLSPSSGDIGSSPALTLSGSFLIGPGVQPTVSASGSGLSVSVTSADSHNVQLNASISPSASPGVDTITLTTPWGSASANFTVNCGSPQISGVNPSSLNAGQNATLAITGSGFCSGSVVTAGSPGGVSLGGSAVVDSGNISATLQVPAADGSETATITVTNPNGASASVPVNIIGSQTGTLFLINPYTLASDANPNISTDLVITAVNSIPGSRAQGIAADGVSTMIAVFVTNSSQAVTFNSNNGATVTPYDPGFLTNNISGDQTSVPVNPVQSGSSFYDIALIRSGTTGGGNSTTVSVGTQSASIITLSAPVVLVHGLWGDQSSLQSTHDYLQAQNSTFTVFPFLNQAICYSPYLAFDATSDTLPGSGGNCEFTSTDSLNTYLNGLYSNLDGNGFVGGSVNLVGHSMGGLVARHYSVTGNYKSIRNRMQGAFRNVISIDTPETGSSLATWLDTVGYNRNLQADPVMNPIPYAAWFAVCLGQISLDLQTCFANSHLPLAYPGADLSTGAVASLMPGGPSLAALPSPFIPNANWRAVTADFQDGTTPGSALRSFLNNIITATYAANDPHQDLSSILGTIDNDVIVTIGSQAADWGGPIGGWLQLCNLAHANLPVIGPVMMGLSTANVTQSDLVNNQVAYYLGFNYTPTPSCFPPLPPPPPIPRPRPPLPPRPINPYSVAVAQANPAVAPLHLTPERLIANLPAGPVQLGQPVEISPLTLRPGKILSMAVEQRDPTSHQAFTNEAVEHTPVAPRSHIITGDVSDDGTSRLRTASTGSSSAQTLTIVPQQVGPLDLILSANYADGGYATQTYHLDVVASGKDVKQFLLNVAPRIPLVLDDAPEDRTFWLAPRVTYTTLKYPIHLANSKQISFNVQQSGTAPVVKVDPDGKIHGLNPGTATITGTFDGVASKVIVTVYPKDKAPAGYIFHHKP